MSEWMADLALFSAGFFAGALNIVAGGGSFLTLPLLIFLGLPPTVANGTNRLAVLLQSVSASWSFHRHGILNWRWALAAGAPATLGAGLGTWAALRVSDELFRKLLAVLMIAITLWTLLDPTRASGEDAARRRVQSPTHPLVVAAFLVVGFYGGFVQAGVGFLSLAITSMAGLDLVAGNTIKSFCILLFTVLSLGLFAWEGMVDWRLGLVLAAGSALGGLLGARWTRLKGHRWIRVVVTVTVIVFAIRIWVAP